MITATLKPKKKMGRPRIFESEMITIGFDVPKAIRDELEVMAKERKITLSALSRELLMDALERLKEKR